MFGQPDSDLMDLMVKFLHVLVRGETWRNWNRSLRRRSNQHALESVRDKSGLQLSNYALLGGPTRCKIVRGTPRLVVIAKESSAVLAAPMNKQKRHDELEH